MHHIVHAFFSFRVILQNVVCEVIVENPEILHFQRTESGMPYNRKALGVDPPL